MMKRIPGARSGGPRSAMLRLPRRFQPLECPAKDAAPSRGIPGRRVDPRSRSHSPRRAFTLIELIISAALMSLILVSAYLCLEAGISSRKIIETRSAIAQNARVALALISADLRSATPLSEDSEFLGMSRMLGDVEADNLDFATHHYTPRAPQEGDFCEVSYYLNPNEETGKFSLWRRRDPTPDPEPLEGGSREEIAQGLAGLRFEYYDGFEWYDEWGDPEGRRRGQDVQSLDYNMYGMPEAVRITLIFDSSKSATNRVSLVSTNSPAQSPSQTVGEPPMIFQTVARLNLAGRYLISSAGSGSSSSNASQGQGGGN